MDVGDDEDFLEEMIKGDEGVGEEEDGFGHADRVREFLAGLGFKVLDAVVGNVTDRSSFRRCDS